MIICAPNLLNNASTTNPTLTTGVSLPTRNPLHRLPSLQNLSSTQSELENSNVNHSGFDIDLSAPESAVDELNIDETSTAPVIEKCSFQRNTIQLMPDIAFQVHLMSQMNEHKDALNHLGRILLLLLVVVIKRRWVLQLREEIFGKGNDNNDNL